MPANQKYLTHSGWHRFAKLLSGILGGYIIAALFHMALALWLPGHKNVLITSAYGIFIIWCVFMLLPFLSKNGWKVMFIYMAIIFLLSLVVYYGNIHHPIPTLR
ncbi:hypothetical protein C1H87_21670 [Flavivirga eckloniae]|uniref:DUF3649 domain-containing protein n=1 Tax=Flavivirga eckloniae TaxID=1803846 RepID=A0A2K9PVU9_9FLAO|nr:hypothetical protein C1H87_21670 [Flavivirga eckloniae]